MLLVRILNNKLNVKNMLKLSHISCAIKVCFIIACEVLAGHTHISKGQIVAKRETFKNKKTFIRYRQANIDNF